MMILLPRVNRPRYDTKYSRMDKVKFVADSL